MIGSSRYVGGLFDGGSGHLHPLNYALGLARAAEAAGARLCEGSRAVALEAGARPTLRTAAAIVRAESVVLACNAHIEEVAPAAAGAVLPVEATIIATAPLPESAGVVPSGFAVSDANRLLDYYRLSPDRRLLFGARLGPGVGPRVPRLVRRMLRVFPQLDGIGVEHRWSGWVALTRNRLPQFGRLGPRTLYAHGFSGHGVALTTLAGKLLAEAVSGGSEGFDEFARIPHRRIPLGRSARPALVGLSALGAALADAL
jgi:gamma-glutamylputrescine oxidase